jgi:hypothetical protein
MKTRENDWWRWAHCIVYGLKGQRGQQQILLPASIRLPRQCVVASGANVVSVAAGEASGIHLCEGSGGITKKKRWVRLKNGRKQRYYAVQLQTLKNDIRGRTPWKAARDVLG